MKQQQVRDKWGLVYGILVLLGVGTLMPWNVFMTEKEFWDIRLHQDPFNPFIAHNFMNLFAVTFNLTNLVAFLFMICFQSGWSMNTQILNPLLIIMAVLASTAMLALRLDLSGLTVANYALPAMGLMGMCMAVLQGGALNLASMFPPIYIQGFVVGAGLSGVATSGLSLIAQLQATSDGGGDRSAADVAPAAFTYFGAATAIIVLCVLTYMVLPRLDYSRAKLAPYLMSRRAAAAAAAAAGGTDLTAALLPPQPGMPPGGGYASKDPDALPNFGGVYPPPQQLLQPLLLPSSKDPDAEWVPPAITAAAAAAAGSSAQPLLQPSSAAVVYLPQQQPGSRYGHVLDEWSADVPLEPSLHGMPARSALRFTLYATSMVLTMAASLSVFPGVAAFICSEHNPAIVSPCAAHTHHGRLYGDLWVPVLFVLFALGDLTGRIVSSWGPWGRRPPAALALLAYAVARFGLVFGLLVCHIVTPTPWRLPTVLAPDYWPLGLVAALGLTQGHLLSTACMHAPAVVPPGRESTFGPLTGLCITLGCLMGSIASSVMMRYLAA